MVSLANNLIKKETYINWGTFLVITLVKKLRRDEKKKKELALALTKWQAKRYKKIRSVHYIKS